VPPVGVVRPTVVGTRHDNTYLSFEKDTTKTVGGWGRGAGRLGRGG